jgi:hypothetical protein
MKSGQKIPPPQLIFPMDLTDVSSKLARRSEVQVELHLYIPITSLENYHRQLPHLHIRY